MRTIMITDDYRCIEDLKQARLRLKLSQREVAHIAGVSQSSVSLFESGKRRPTENYLSTLRRLEREQHPHHRRPRTSIEVSRETHALLNTQRQPGETWDAMLRRLAQLH